MTRDSRLPGVRLRLLAGAAGLALAARLVHRDRVEPAESEVFETVNQLPDRLYPAVWAVMQCGNLVAAPAAAAVAAASGRPRLARRLLVSGVLTWLLAKVVKAAVRRPRPDRLLPASRVTARGAAQSGLGFASGHTAVAVALWLAAYPQLTPSARRMTASIAAVVGASRMYIGAHLPLDVVGGAALGMATEAVVELVSEASNGVARAAG